MKNFVCFMIAIVLTFMLHATAFAGERKVVDIRELAPRFVYDGLEKCINDPCKDDHQICFKNTYKGRDQLYRARSESCKSKVKQMQLQKKTDISMPGDDEGKIPPIFTEPGCRENECPLGPAWICWGENEGGILVYYEAMLYYCAPYLPPWMEKIPDLGDPPPMGK